MPNSEEHIGEMSSDALIGRDISSYHIKACLGVGGMGSVYLGVHPLIGKKVAIKVLHPEFAEKADVIGRFFNEARAVSLLRHPNIVELIDFGKTVGPQGEQIHYCIMELLEGETVRSRLKRTNIIPEHEAAYIASQISDAVAAAHRQQIIHRDLKPENVFLVGPNMTTVKLLDFGIAKLQDPDAAGAASVKTQAGVLLGTPSYMSPEQCMGRPVDRRTDIYAVGVILFEMCTGRLPFQGEGYAELLIKQISADVPRPRSINPSLSEAIERIIMRALEKDPAKRFQTMDELHFALSEIPEDSDDAPPPPFNEPPNAEFSPMESATLQGVEEFQDITQVPVYENSSTRRIFPWVAIIVGVLIIAGVLSALLLRNPDHKKPPKVMVQTTLPTNDKPPPSKTTVETPSHIPTGAKTRLHITSEPSGAEVQRDDTGDVLGTTPFDAELEANGSLLRLSVHKEGYKDAARPVTLMERASTISFHLVPEAPGAKPTVAPATKTPTAPVAKPPVAPTTKTPTAPVAKPPIAAPTKPTPTKKRSSRVPGGHLGDDILAPTSLGP